MLLTFKTPAYANITMFGESGLQMLEMMAFGSAVPGAINAEDLPQALQNLQTALDKLPRQSPPREDQEDEPPGLHTRAFPLLELLRAAIAEEAYLSWE